MHNNQIEAKDTICEVMLHNCLNNAAIQRGKLSWPDMLAAFKNG